MQVSRLYAPQYNNTDIFLVVIQDSTGFGLFHPIHLHGHDFWVVAQDVGTFDPAKTNITTTNPPRRDVATLPGNGVSSSLLEPPLLS